MVRSWGDQLFRVSTVLHAGRPKQKAKILLKSQQNFVFDQSILLATSPVGHREPIVAGLLIGVKKSTG